MSDLDLVTGGAGFIGSHLCRKLIERGRRVRVLDDLSSGCLDNLAPVREQGGDRLEFIRGGLLDDKLNAALQGVETVYHQAALVSVRESIADPLACYRVNIDGTLRLFERARDAGVQRVVYASSSAVYGDAELPNTETMPLLPASPYAASKGSGELFGEVYSGQFGLPAHGLRYFNVFGPRQDPSSEYSAVIPRFISRMLAGREPIVFGDGEQSRDFIYVDNVVAANLAAASSDPPAGAINIASGRAITLNLLVEQLNDILGTRLEPRYEAARAGEIRHSVADIQRAGRRIGYRVEVPFEEGLARTVDWYRRRRRL